VPVRRFCSVLNSSWVSPAIGKIARLSKLRRRKFSMKNFMKVFALLVAGLLFAGLLTACGADATATPAAVATTAATSATTAASSATTAAATGGAISAVAKCPSDADVICIYSSLPRTGSSKAQTDTIVKAYLLSIEDFTKGTGKVGNFKIALVDGDDATPAKGQWDAQQEAANANEAVNTQNVMVYAGTFNSGAAAVSVSIINKANMVMISPANTNDCLTVFEVSSGCKEEDLKNYYPTGSRHYFRLAARDGLQGAALAKFMKGQNIKKLFVIDDSQVYGKGLADGFVASAKSEGLELIDRASISGKETDYKTLASTIKSKSPDAIFFGGITQQQAGKLVSDIRAANIVVGGKPIPFFGGEGILENAFIKDAGIAAEGTYATIAGVRAEDLGAKAQDFLKRYRAKFGEPEAYTVFGYDLMNVTLTAIQTTNKKDRAEILKSLQAIKEFDGVLGKWSFDKNGDISLSSFVVNQVKEGKWVEISSVTVAK
jgi:branched-chain amino acid transport system substrate-binding protein